MRKKNRKKMRSVPIYRKISRKTQRALKKAHDEAVNKIAENPEILKIPGLTRESLLSEPIKFPELRRKGQETGDLILIWSPCLREWVISVIELQVGAYRPEKKAVLKLKMTFNYLKGHWREWMESIGLNLPEDYTLSIRPTSVSYAGKPLWEQPFVHEIKTNI